MTNTTITARWTRRAGIAAATTGLMALGLTPASAHVSAEATTTAAGGYTRITFSVPNESDTASTEQIQITLPEDAPFASVRTQPVPGWSAEVTETELATPAPAGEGSITEAASAITWTAEEGHSIDPGQFQTFTISAGPLPEEEGQQLLLPVSQTYTDGRTVAWDDPATQGQEEPEHPAPTLTVTAAEADSHGSTDEAAAAAENTAATTDTSITMGWAGLIAGLLGLAAGATALVRTRRN